MYASLDTYGSLYNREYFSELQVEPIEVTDRTLSQIYKKSSILFIYAPWCLHCTLFKPMYQELSQQTFSIPLGFYKLNADDWPTSVGLFQIQGFPTIVLLKNNQPFYYSGNRTIPLIRSWIESILQK